MARSCKGSVLYNGVEPYPDEQILKLSDSFIRSESLDNLDSPSPSLELEVRVLNINAGRNKAIVKKCKDLADYSVFIAKVREYEQTMPRKEAIIAAIKYCKAHGILVPFLEKYGTEVLSMLLTEWNTADAIAVARKEGIETGIEQGIEQGIEKGIEKGRAEERKEWQSVVAKKDVALAEQAALIAELQARLGEKS